MQRNFLASLFVGVLVCACGGDEPGDGNEGPASGSVSAASISGSVVLSESIGLTAEAKLEIRLQDVSLADAPARVIASRQIDNPGQSPIEFSLAYDASLIDERHSYGVSAKVFDGGHLIFISDTFHPVITHGAPREVVVRTVRIARSKLDLPDAPFVGTKWLLKTVNGSAVTPGPEQTEPYLLASSADQVGGNAGCNQFNGGYTLAGDAISIGNVGVTMMMCPDGNEIEQQFLKALSAMDRIRIAGGTMLAYGEGSVVASFEAEQ